MSKAFVYLVVSLVIATTSYADVYTGGTGGPINDNSTGSGTLLVSNPGYPTISTFNSITVTLGHSWVGDLTFWLTAPNGDDAQLFRQPGSGTFGDTSDLVGAYTFVNSGAAGGDFHTAVIAAPSVLPPGTYNRSNVSGVTTPFTGPDPDDFTVFDQDNINGTWTLRWRDNAVGDIGSVTSWSMNITSVPEPGSFIALGLLGLIGLRSRRNR